MKHLQPFNEDTISREDARKFILSRVDWKIVEYMKDLITGYEDNGKLVYVCVDINDLTVYYYVDGKEHINPYSYTLRYRKGEDINIVYYIDGSGGVDTRPLIQRLNKKFPDATFK